MACELDERYSARSTEPEMVECLSLDDLLDEVLDRIEKTNGLEFVPEDLLYILIDYFRGELISRNCFPNPEKPGTYLTSNGGVVS